MRFPVIAAIDPRRVDTAPARLGAVLARLLDAPLVLAASFPVEPAVDRLYTEYSRTLRLETERALRPVEDAVAALPDRRSR
jgi:hypothetical protein